MNWLAHVYLSESNPAFRVGNLLPDLLSGPALNALPQRFQAGIRCHLAIDRFTDSHPLVRERLKAIAPPYRRFAPILIDVFFDHFLSVQWKDYSHDSLPAYLDEVYSGFAEVTSDLPERTHGIIQQMSEENWLGSYGDAAGVRLTLHRISRRFRRPVDLAPAAELLLEHYHELSTSFAEFFPQLRASIETNRGSPATS